jgi:betaine-aldehyde dehydrogenase
MREPIGVAGIIVPWNSPLALLVRALGPALAAGCTTVIKLPGQTALVNSLIAEAVAATGSLPKGVVNIFTEAGNEGAPLLVESSDVDVINYTGSTKVGRQVAEKGAQTLKRICLELGGKTPLIVFEDADIEAFRTPRRDSAHAVQRRILHDRLASPRTEKCRRRVEATNRVPFGEGRGRSGR